MLDFLAQLESALRGLDVSGTSVLVAVSGGADSVALLRGLLAVRQELFLTVAAAHLNHGLRGAARGDAEWVAALCETLAVPCVVEAVDIAADAAARGLGIEEASRDARYSFLQRVARARVCPIVAVAHTSDDQAETILHRILRGTGLSGLRGMPASRPLAVGVRLVRPLLGFSRAELLAYLAELGQDFREDVSNLDPRFTRNRIRHTLLPLLRAGFNPSIENALLRLGTQADEMHDLAQALAADLLNDSLADSQPTLVRLDCRPLAAAPRAVVRETLRLVWRRQNWPQGGMTFDHWDAAAGLARTGGKSLTLPGPVRAQRREQLLVLESQPCGK